MHTRAVIIIAVTLSSAHLKAGSIAWFYALDSDKAAFDKIVGPPLRSVTSGSIAMHDYRIGPHRVVASKMGSGCATTATTVATVMALNPAERLISTGPAGGLSDKIKPGVWIRVQEVIAWQKGRSIDGGKVAVGSGSAYQISFDEKSWTDGPWRKVIPVKLASGEAFVSSNEARSAIAADTGAAAVDMNTYGLLAATEGRSIKLLVLRIISDRADDHASENFADFSKNYDGSGGEMVAQIIKALPVSADEPATHDALRDLLK